MDKIDKIKTLAQQMIDADIQRDVAFKQYQEMYHCLWTLPDGLSRNEIPWIHKVVSTLPHDAIATPVKILSTLDPRVNLQPMLGDQANRERANMVERILLWQLKSANRRRPQKVEADMVQSALMYSAIAANVIDLDWQVKQVAAVGGNARRWEAMRRYGRFVVNTYNPRDVHVRFSNYMPEAVLLCQKRKAQAVYDEWGTRKLRELAEADADVDYYDYMDYDQHAVWCDDVTVLPPTDTGLPFLNWVALVGGSTLEADPQHQYHSLLYSVFQSGQWETQNTVDTLRVSEAIASAARPRLAEEGMNPNQDTEVDALDPSRIAKVTPGNTLRDLPPNYLDPALSQISDGLTGRIQQSTVSQVLMGGQVPSGTAFSTLNLLTQTAVGQIKPYKGLAEQGLAEMFILMLLWVEFTGVDLVAYEMDRKMENYGEEYVIEADEIDPQSIYLEVELSPDVPTDRQARLNAALMGKQGGLMSTERGMEEVGIMDPQREMEAIWMERIEEALMQLQIQNMQYMGSAQVQEQKQQEQAAQAAQEQQMMSNQGMMANPAQGGLPPAMANPQGMTREAVTQTDRSGLPVLTEEEMLA